MSCVQAVASSRKEAMMTRFHRSRWSRTRREIAAMLPHQAIVFLAREYPNAKASVERLNYAYDGEKLWAMTTIHRVATVTRIQ